MEELFIEDATWRDFMAFPWDFHHTIGRAETAEKLIELVAVLGGRGLRAKPGAAAADRRRQDQRVLRLHARATAIDRGYVFLVPTEDGYAASILQTQVQQLTGLPRAQPASPPGGQGIWRRS